MSLKPCPECGNPVSSDAANCPKCGKRVIRSAGTALATTIAIVFFSLLVAAIATYSIYVTQIAPKPADPYAQPGLKQR